MCQNTLWTLKTIWKCIVWNVIKWWYFYTNICFFFFFHLGLWEQSSDVGFEQTDVCKVYTSPSELDWSDLIWSELEGIFVGSRWVFSLTLNVNFSFFYFYYYYLLGVLSNLCSWASFYDWCGILHKLLSAKLLHVIPQNFSWWQIPGDGTLLSKGPRGWDQQSWIMFSALQRQIVSFGEEVATSYPLPTKLLLPRGRWSPLYEHFPRPNGNLQYVQGSKIF